MFYECDLRCFLTPKDHHTGALVSSLLNRTGLTFHVDGKSWQAETHRLDPGQPADTGQFSHACRLLEQRYEWKSGERLNNSSIIVRLDNIEEII